MLIAGAYFMENLDATIIAPAAPAIAESFGVQAVQINVAMTAYLLTVAVLIPGSGWLSDRFGARSVFTLAILLFTLASIGCAMAPTLTALTVARVVQGIGGAMMVPVGLADRAQDDRESGADQSHRLSDLARFGRARAGPTPRRADQHLHVMALDLPDQRPARDHRVDLREAAGA